MFSLLGVHRLVSPVSLSAVLFYHSPDNVKQSLPGVLPEPRAVRYDGNMKRSFFAVARMLALVYAGLVLVMASCQRSMLYYPSRADEEMMLRLAAREGLAPWRNAEGGLIGWHSPGPPDAADTLLAFHGNAGFAAHRSYLSEGFRPHVSVYLFEYPGYGARGGRPSEKEFYRAAEQAFEQLKDERPGRIFLAGESLGSGVAAYLAGQHPDQVSGLFLITPFDSLVSVAQGHYPFLPVRWFMRDRYESARHLESYHGPVAILLAERDEVVPARFGEKLYEAYHGPKKRWIQEGRSHNTLDYNPDRSWWAEVAAFLKQPLF